ncbi:hypothetical protein WJX74_009942 [Apatococcus lobatus]|uniref:Choline monooxygenase, chloroplastic n=1 Tax=Apatococcus lobatus TaxID=904363 RepID=A0AAW1SHA9_9CHLO
MRSAPAFGGLRPGAWRSEPSSSAVGCPKQREATKQRLSPCGRAAQPTYRAQSPGPLPLEFWSSAAVPLEEASTPPSSWYTSTAVQSLEQEHVFGKNWLYVGHQRQATSSGDFFTTEAGNVRLLVTRQSDGRLQAFHNVCRHRGAAVAHGSGYGAKHFQGSTSGWRYGLDGTLLENHRLQAVRGFQAAEHSLLPVHTTAWGPFIFVHLDRARHMPDVQERLGRAEPRMRDAGMLSPELQHVGTRSYHLSCNWKVFVDNYLDGGYHVPFAHPGLASALDMEGYWTELYETVSLQCSPLASQPAPDEWADLAAARTAGGHGPVYAFIYPNLMINRYGSSMDTNLVLPTGVSSCKVIFDWYTHHDQACNDDHVRGLIEGSEKVQEEDMGLCAEVQLGLSSPAYDVGRYVPAVEGPMFHFHQLLYDDLRRG